MRPLSAGLLALALAMPSSAWAKKAVKADKSTSADEEAPPPPTMEERTAAFGEIDEAMKSGQKAKAADLLCELVENEEHAVFHAEAYARLAALLDQLDLPYAALVAYERALSTDAEGVSSVAKDAIRLADKVGDTALLEEVFAANVGLDVDADTRSRMAYLAARDINANGQSGTALAILKMVKKTDPYYPEAKALEGVALSLQSRHKDALAPLLTAQEAGKAGDRGERFDNVLQLNIARAYFGAENFPRAIEYYAKVQRESPFWPAAQYERAWAHFRIEDMNGTLGILHSHDSPFFTGWYFPEANLLRIYSLFLLCKFPEASKEIDVFNADYGPVKQELAQIAASPEAEVWDKMARHIELGPRKAKTGLPEMVTRIWEAEDRFNDNLTAVRHAEDELERLQNVSANPFSERASAWVSDRKAEIIAAEGRRIKDHLQGMSDQLGTMLTDAEMGKLDMLQLETRLYERASVAGELADVRRTVARSDRKKKFTREWPFEGEYWMDEVGYYRIKSKPECPEGLQTGKPQ